MTQRGRWVSIGDRLLGSQVSKARPGAPFDGCRRSERSNCSPDSPTEFGARDDKGKLRFSRKVVAADKAFFKSNLDGFEFSMGLTMLGAAGPYFKIPDLRPTSRKGVSGKFAVSVAG